MGNKTIATTDTQNIVRMEIPVTIEAPKDLGERIVRFIASDEGVDRYRTTISSKGWELANFRKNPMFLFGHEYRSPVSVMGRVVNVTKDVQRKALLADVLFAPAAINPMAEMVYQMYTHKPPFLNAVSVGFIPLEQEEVKSDDTEKTGKGPTATIRYTRQELIELSGVTVPANPGALIDKATEAGIDPVLVMEARSVMPEIGDEEEREGLRQRMCEWMRSCAAPASSVTIDGSTTIPADKYELVPDDSSTNSAGSSDNNDVTNGSGDQNQGDNNTDDNDNDATLDPTVEEIKAVLADSMREFQEKLLADFTALLKEHLDTIIGKLDDNNRDILAALDAQSTVDTEIDDLDPDDDDTDNDNDGVTESFQDLLNRFVESEPSEQTSADNTTADDDQLANKFTELDDRAVAGK
jgi:hypothetical protein